MRQVGRLLLFLAVASSGCVAPAAESPAATSAPQEEASGVASLRWEGFATSDVTAELAHTKPFSQILARERVGFSADLPEGLRELEVVLAWDPPARPEPVAVQLNILVHSAHDHATGQMTTYVTDTSSAGWICARVPAAELAPGKWEFMSRRTDYTLATPFTITLHAVGGAPTLVEEIHGHDRAEELNEAREDVAGEFEPCAMAEGAGARSHLASRAADPRR